MRSLLLMSVVVGLASLAAGAEEKSGEGADWSEQQVAKLPESEKPIRLFNGKDLTGWEGQKKKYWSVVDGMIVGKNSQENAPQASTYLVTKDKHRNFRLIFEAKLAESEMHTGIALWAKPSRRAAIPTATWGTW
jgi:hypothetical protein